VIVKIVRVRMVAAGFVVSYHQLTTPGDVRATVLSPEQMPSGHELLRGGAVVDLVFDGGKVAYVSAAKRAQWPTQPARVA
jgi:hypothetical protein